MGLGIIKAFHNPFFLNYFFHGAFLPVQLCGWMGDRVNIGAYQACVRPGKELKGARQDPRPLKVTANARGHSAATTRAWSRAGRRSPQPPGSCPQQPPCSSWRVILVVVIYLTRSNTKPPQPGLANYRSPGNENSTAALIGGLFN